MNVQWIKGTLAATVVAASAFLTCSEASAQSTNPWRNTLSNPAVSPYLSLLQRQSEGLPLYYTQVRPRIEQMEFNRNQETAVNRVQSQVNTVQAQQGVGQFGPIGIRPTGRTGISDYRLMFQNRAHYYPAPR